MSVEAYKIFEENYSFKNKGQEKSPLSAWSLMCWREAFVWGYDWQQKRIDKLEESLRCTQYAYDLLKETKYTVLLTV